MQTCAGTVSGIAPSGVGDNCGVDSVSYTLSGATTGSGLNDASGTFFNYGVTTVTYTVTDISGNTTSCNFTITVNDNINPNILCPLSVSVNTDPGVCSATVTGIAPTIANDNCGVDSIHFLITGATSTSGLNDASGTVFNVGVSTIQYTITDLSGNTSSCSFSVTVSDNELPTLNCPSNLVTPNDPSSCAAVVNGIAPTGVSDNCGVDSLNYIITGATSASGLNDASGTLFNVGLSTVNYYIVDINGNRDSCSFTITVNDMDPPQISCPASVNTMNDPGLCTALINGIGPTSFSDNCSIDSINYLISGATVASGLNDASGTLFNVGVSNVNYYIYDLAGNVDSCGFNVTVVDSTRPVFSCPSNISMNNDSGNCSAIVSGIGLVGLLDNCGIDSVSYTLSGATVGSGLNDASGSSINVGATTVKYLVFDVNGNADSCTFNVTVLDNELPTIGCPGSFTDSTDLSQCTAVINGLSPLMVNDNCGVDTVFYVLNGATQGSGANDASGTNFNRGVTTIQYVVIDVNGNTDSCSFQLTVVDVESPTITCVGNMTVSTDTNTCTALVNNIAPLAFGDNCVVDSISYTITGATFSSGLNDASGTIFNAGLSQVTYTIVDSSGNVDSCSFTILVDDNEKPVVVCPSSVVQSNDSGQCGAQVNAITPLSSSDNCAIDSLSFNITGATIGSGLNDASGLFFEIGVSTVTYIIYDMSGNVDSCSFTVTISDNESPIINCPSDIVICDTSVTVPLPTASDNCLLLSVLNDYNSSIDASDVYPYGVTVVQWTATDTAGNMSTCSFSVEVEVEPIAIAGEDQILLGVNSTSLNANFPNPGNGNWSNTAGYGVVLNSGDPNSPLANLDPGTNTFLWTVSNGTCTDAFDEVDIKFIPLLVPSGFSPNGDGDNDYFVIEGIETVENQMTIFNRWGVELFDTFNYENDWDGRGTSGEDLPEDTYFYVLKIPVLNKELSGYIVLKR